MYLANGQAINLVKELDGGKRFLVEPIIEYYDENGNLYGEECGPMEIVNKIYSTAPTAKIDAKFKKINDLYEIKKKELSNLGLQIQSSELKAKNLTKQKTNVKKLIYNRSELINSNRITVFNTSKILPQDFSEKVKQDFKLIIELTVLGGQERAWTQTAYGDGSWSSSEPIDMDYGFIIDATDKEIEIITKKRAQTISIEQVNKYCLSQTPDQYLTKEQKAIKQETLNKQEQKDVDYLKKTIDESQKKLEAIYAKRPKKKTVARKITIKDK